MEKFKELKLLICFGVLLSSFLINYEALASSSDSLSIDNNKRKNFIYFKPQTFYTSSIDFNYERILNSKYGILATYGWVFSGGNKNGNYSELLLKYYFKETTKGNLFYLGPFARSKYYSEGYSILEPTGFHGALSYTRIIRYSRREVKQFGVIAGIKTFQRNRFTMDVYGGLGYQSVYFKGSKINNSKIVITDDSSGLLIKLGLIAGFSF